MSYVQPCAHWTGPAGSQRMKSALTALFLCSKPAKYITMIDYTTAIYSTELHSCPHPHLSLQNLCPSPTVPDDIHPHPRPSPVTFIPCMLHKKHSIFDKQQTLSYYASGIKQYSGVVLEFYSIYCSINGLLQYCCYWMLIGYWRPLNAVVLTQWLTSIPR